MKSSFLYAYTIVVVVVGGAAAFQIMGQQRPPQLSLRRQQEWPLSNGDFLPQQPKLQRSLEVTLYLSEKEDMDTAEADDIPTLEDLSERKAKLVRLCNEDTKPSVEDIRMLVNDLESAAELLGEGQSSSFTGLLSGEWELVYSPEDITRSSPFFGAFRKAFPENADQIFGITDAIPAPIKEVGPAIQTIDLNSDTKLGTFVSRVKLAALGGISSSMMTTRASIVGVDGNDGIRLKIETTKPEDSTILEKLLPGPLGSFVNENAPPFPSGDALEQVKPGSSEVILRTTFCDEGLRVSRYEDKYDDPYVWVRNDFAKVDVL